ncbi:DUF559 domain-containing protein [Nocardioides solisilvae]|uniref:DUF559 domain-containing protein n=1 Tax=Nocardioides solisilvae TaxID=1542435 RepID=UPI0013A57353|nr:DUF559 domain-containing protein [Nocardioides solisilvae]
MGVEEALRRLGGVASTAELVTLTSRRRLHTAVRSGLVVRAGRGRYVLGSTPAHRAAAVRLHGVLSHTDAALHWGWKVKVPPDLPHVTVSPRRHLRRGDHPAVHLHWRAVRDDEARGGVTTPLRTALDCARDLPFDEALAVVDSALRQRAVCGATLRAAAADLRGPGSARARRVVALADGRAANPFESVLRALAVEAGLTVLPQHAINVGGLVLHPDLADPARLLVLEADSWTHHAGHAEHDQDCTRYNALVVAGWRVLRFTWRQVMLQPGYVRAVLAALV